MKGRTVLILAVVALLLALPWQADDDRPRVASKKFTESIILGEMLAQLARSEGIDVVHQAGLGGTRIVFEALRGRISAYVEYTGTLDQELVPAGVDRASFLAANDLVAGGPLGFNNSYVLAMRADRARELGIARISDLTRHPDLRLGFSDEFMARRDGWPGLREHYGLSQTEVRGLDHDVAYRLLASGALDVLDAYATDADIAAWGLTLLEDDRGFFPRYDAIVLRDRSLDGEWPAWAAALGRLEGALDEATMRALNARVRLGGKTESRVAADFLEEKLGIVVTPDEPTRVERILLHTSDHLRLVRMSLAIACLLGVPLGILAARHASAGRAVIAVTSVVQTIPALALLVLLIRPAEALDLPQFGTVSTPAVTALVLYTLLPIVRNTVTGLHGIARPLRESADALGLSRWTRLLRVDLPLAAPTIVAGVKTGAVLNVGFATLGALIGAGGYGQPILTGIRLDKVELILEGAVPAALMALAVQAAFGWLEKLVSPPRE